MALTKSEYGILILTLYGLAWSAHWLWNWFSMQHLAIAGVIIYLAILYKIFKS